MSTASRILTTNSQITTTYDVAKIFIWNNRFVNESVVNSEYDPWELKSGTVMGRITGTGTIVPCSDDATDGSQNPIGLLNGDYTIKDGTTVTVSLCTSGDVAEEQVICLAPLTLEYVIQVGTVGIRMRDRIRANTGINLVTSSDNTYPDNQ